jgi:threonine/homoserine/homoserine lactone efflux protein
VSSVGEALGQMLPLALVIGLSPPPVIAVVVILVGARARTNAPALVFGWIAGIGVLGAVVLVIADAADASDDGGPATWVSVLKLAIGLALVLLAVRKWSGRPDSDDVLKTPGWMSALDAFGPLKSAGLGVALSAANPKNVLLIIGAAATEAQEGLSAGTQAAVWAIFGLLASLGVLAPLLAFYALGDRAPAVLERVNTWMIRNSAVMTAALCLLIGVTLVGNAISGY